MVEFKCDNNFYIRVPYYSFNFYNQHLKSVQEMNIEEFVKENFKENLIVSSKGLYDSIINHKGNYDAKKNSLLKYLIRSSTRCTPYGLNSGVIQGTFGENTQFKLNKDFLKKARPDMEWIVKVVKKLEISLAMDLRVIRNNAIDYNKYTVFKRWNSCYMNDSISNKSKISIDNTQAVQQILNLTSSYISIREIIEQLKRNYPEINTEFLYKFILSMVKNEFLISDLRTALIIPNQFGVLLQKIKKYKIENNYFQSIYKVKQNLDEYNKKKVSKGAKEYLELINLMKSIAPAENYLQVDMYQDSEIILEQGIKTDIEDLANFLAKWTYSETYNEYILKFKDKYGEQAVKYLDLIDNEIGLGIPTIDKHSSIKFKDDFESAFSSALIDGIMNKEENIDLSKMNDFENTNISDYSIKSSAELAFYLTSSNVKGLYNLTFSPLVGSEEYGKSMGRFNYLLNEVNSSEENEKDKQEEKVEVTFLPDVAHHANVLTFTSKNKYFIEYGTETETEKLNKISLEDIYAFVYKDELKLVHKNTGKIIDACASNMFSIEGYPKELKCLLEISAHQKAHLLTLQMQLIHIINSLKGPCPRITYKNFILVPKSWRLNSERYYINGDFLDEDSFYKMFDKMVDAQNIPQSVFIGPSDQKLLLNIKNKNHRDILYKLFKKNPDLVIYENIFSEDNLLLEGSNGEKFIGEFVFSVRKKEKSLNLMKIDVSKTSFLDFELSKQNSFSPFEEWISIKYYFKEDFQDNIIKDFVKDLYLRLIKKNIISTFFFIRYKDPKSHLRVRMKIKENKYKEFIEIYSSFLQDTNIKHLLTDCIMDTYVQEFARYGGENCISYAEEVFHSDSISCMEMIEMYRNKTLSFSKIELFIISSIKMLDYMGIGLGDQVDYLSNYNAGKKFNEEYNKLSSKLSEIIDGKDNWKHLRLAESGVNLFISISNLEKPCKKYWEIIESECKGYSGNKEYILQSILHMHFNRLVGINRGLETRVMSYLYKFIYTKYSKMKYLNKKGNNEKGVII